MFWMYAFWNFVYTFCVFYKCFPYSMVQEPILLNRTISKVKKDLIIYLNYPSVILWESKRTKRNLKKEKNSPTKILCVPFYFSFYRTLWDFSSHF